MPTLTAVTDVDADVAAALATSLDLDVEVAAGRRHRVAAVDAGPGSRTSGAIGLGERVRRSTRLHGVLPVRHTTQITELHAALPGGAARFVDAMVSGAFTSFRHEHDLAPLPPDPATGAPRTRMTDRVTWRSPLGPLGRVADAVLVRRTLAGLLADRNAELARRLGGPSTS